MHFYLKSTEVLAYLGTSLSLALDLLDKKTLQRRAAEEVTELGTYPVPCRWD